MLILTRRKEESIIIDDVNIVREELLDGRSTLD